MLLSVILLLAYSILILTYYKFFINLKEFHLSDQLEPVNSFSIIIPARNEEENIKNCVTSIFQNNYPAALFEVIVADDFSIDNTARIVTDLQKNYSNLKLIKLSDVVKDKINSYKKKAIELAINESKNVWIITTDADCTVQQQWLQLFNAFIETHQPVFIAAPVIFKNSGSLISIFQCLDFMTLQGITAASVSAGFHSMCNGANLAYKKEAFYEVDGFKGIDNIASGDDMLLMHKIQKKYSNKTGYLFNAKAVVSTLPMPDWRSFINQRLRWASKATSYKDKRIFAALLLVYFFNLHLFILLIASILNSSLFIYWLILIAVKTLVELIFLIPVTHFFNQKKLLFWFVIMQPIHITYTVLSGFLGTFGKYEWKGRNVK